MDLATLGLEIRSDGVVVAKDRLKGFEDQANRTSKATDILVRAFGLLATAFSVTKLIQYTNTWTDLNSRVNIATGSITAGAAAMNRLTDMARRTYSSLELTAESFLRNSTAMRDLGYSTDQTLNYVEAINNALVVSGTKGERAESVMNALGKAMALGKLSGDELNTVIGSGGRIAQALADSLGVTTLELRKMGTEGKLTGDVIYRGLTGQLETLREEADSMPATIGDAFVLLNNAVLEAVGTFDQMSGASGKVAEGIIWVADNLEMFTPILSGVAAVIAVALVPALASAAAATWALTAALLANPLTWVALAVGAVVAAAVLLIQRMGGVSEAFLTVQTVAMDVWDRIKLGGQSLADVMSGVALMVQGAFTRAWANIAQGFADLVGSMGGAAGMFGLDAGGAAEFAKGLHTQAAAYEAGSQISFGHAADNWGAATGPGAATDNIGLGASWGGMQDAFGANDNGLGTPGAGGASGGPAAKADEYAKLTKSILENIEVMKVEAETIGMTEYQATKLSTAQELLRAAAEAGRPLTTELVTEINTLAQSYADASLQAEGARLELENLSPWEEMGMEIQRLDEMLARGAIGWNTYASAISKAVGMGVGSLTSMASEAAGLLGQMFEDSKEVAIAQAVLSGAEGVARTLGAYPFPFNIALAGLHAAAAAGQVAAIMSTNKSSSSTVRAPSGGSAPTQPNAPQRQQGDKPADRSDVYLHGLDRNAMYSGENIERIIALIEERSGDGRILNIKVA